MVRAGDDNELVDVFVTKGVAGVGYALLEDPKYYSTKKEMTKKATEIYPQIIKDSNKDAKRVGIQKASQLWTFATEIQKGDKIVTYNKKRREYIVGTAISDPFFDNTIIGDGYPNCIRVKWELNRIPRDALSEETGKELGDHRTVFRIDDHAVDELLSFLEK